MMGRHIGLRNKLNVLSIGLVILTATGIAGFVVYREITTRSQDLLNTGLTTAAMMAQSSEYAVYTENQDSLRRIVASEEPAACIRGGHGRRGRESTGWLVVHRYHRTGRESTGVIIGPSLSLILGCIRPDGGHRIRTTWPQPGEATTIPAPVCPRHRIRRDNRDPGRSLFDAGAHPKPY